MEEAEEEEGEGKRARCLGEMEPTHSLTVRDLNRTVPEETLSFADGLFWMYMAVSIFLVLFAGLMSGLTLGLLSLDLVTSMYLWHTYQRAPPPPRPT